MAEAMDSLDSDVVNLRKIFFSNLLLLGFDPSVNEAETRIKFHRDMFQVPNRAAFEIVVKFLLDRLDPIRSKQEFRDCWPMYDKKREMLFHRTCIAWLSQIAEEPGTNFPSVGQSLFLSPAGNRCDQLVANLSRHVMKHVMKTELGDKGTLNPNLNDTQFNLRDEQAKVILCATIAERKKYFDSLRKSVKETEEMVNFARWLESRFVKMPTEAKLSDQRARHSEMLLKKVQKDWSAVNNLSTETEQERKVIQSVLQGGMERYKISADDISLRVPNRLLEGYERDMNLRSRGNTYTEGKVNILSVLDLFNMALSSISNKISEEDLPSFSEKAQKLNDVVVTQKKQLSRFISLRSNVSDVILPQVKQSNSLLSNKHHV